jgi:hypothetical protein
MIMLKDKQKLTIDPDILILELSELYPEVVDFLITEYEFHCIGCIMAGFESLRIGAEAHGISGKDFEEMLRRINELINQDKISS